MLESNQQPADYKSATLPVELMWLMVPKARLELAREIPAVLKTDVSTNSTTSVYEKLLSLNVAEREPGFTQQRNHHRCFPRDTSTDRRGICRMIGD